MKLGSIDNALADYNKSLELDQECCTHGAKAFAYFKQEDYPCAIEEFDKALKLDEKCLQSNLGKIRALTYNGDSKEANELMNKNTKEGIEHDFCYIEPKVEFARIVWGE